MTRSIVSAEECQIPSNLLYKSCPIPALERIHTELQVVIVLPIIVVSVLQPVQIKDIVLVLDILSSCACSVGKSSLEYQHVNNTNNQHEPPEKS